MMEIGFVHKFDEPMDMEQGNYNFTSDEMAKLASILKTFEAEVQRLQLENRRLEMEKEVLMKLLEKLVNIQKGEE